jgi:small ligand-binding sensory domain FIST
MQQFLLGHAAHDDWRQALQQCLARIGRIPAEANFGFLYTTDAIRRDLDDVLTTARQATGITEWIGTVGMGICAGDREYYETPAIAVLLADLPEDAFRVFHGFNQTPQFFDKANADWVAANQTSLAVVHGDPRYQQLPDAIVELAESLPSGYLIGGVSSSAGRHPQIANVITQGGLSGAIFNQRIEVVTGHTQGCAPIGPQHTITACERNILISVDDRPALDVFREDIGEILARDLNRAAGYIFAALPIPGSDTGDYLVRNLVGINLQEKLLGIGDLLHTGRQILFCRRDGASAEQDLQRMLDDLLHRTPRRPRGALYYSCVGRGRHQFGGDSRELGIIQAALGNVPLAGFFANGEISNNRLYGYTGVLTLFL